MKKRIYKLFYLGIMAGILLLLSVGCVKLVEKPIDFASPQTYYNNPSQVTAAYAASMGNLYGYWVLYDYLGYTDYYQNEDQYATGNLVIGNNFSSHCYGNHYAAIADLNPVIAALNADKLGSSASQDVKDQLMALGKFLRAFNYFQLVRLYGPVPLILETTNPLATDIVRAPITDVYAQIISDLTFATQKLPAVQDPSNPGSPSVDVAKLLLAKVYVTMATYPLNDPTNYAKAAAMAKQVMDDGNYSLVPDITQVFNLNNSFGPEMMWSYHNVKGGVQSIEPQIWLPYEMGGWGGLFADHAWAIKFPDEPRKGAYLVLQAWPETPLPGWPQYVPSQPWTLWSQDQPSVGKYLYDTHADIMNYTNFENFPILRYADALLIYAEAANMSEGGPSPAACAAVNQIINRATGGVPNPADPLLTTSMSQQAFDDAIIQQRNLELCFENDRWFDIIRKRILKQVSHPYVQQNFTENDYLMPIPDVDLLNNRKLTQNPGYTLPY